MPRQLKDYDLVIDYAAFMLAIVFARHLVDHSNVRFQWSAETLSENMKNLNPEVVQISQWTWLHWVMGFIFLGLQLRIEE